MKTVCVIGLGYIGLPTASMFATHGTRVVGVDVDETIVNILQNGDVHIEEAGLRTLVQAAIGSGHLTVTTKTQPADAFIVAVPTPINADHSADMRAVIAATESIVPLLRPGNLVVLESTSPPGTTTGLVRTILERSGLSAGRDFMLAYSPERVLPGQILRELIENARVIGGIDEQSAQAGRDLYRAFVQGDILLTDATNAEMIKLMENAYRDVNIALANEFALIAEAMGTNVWEAIAIANRHPRVNILRPGPGVGGHCIAVDPWFLVEVAPQCARLIRQARLVNDGMPDHVVALAQRATNGVTRPVIACLGLTFKADVDDTRESPAIEVVHKLAAAGMTVRAFDPYVVKVRALPGQLSTSVSDAVSGADLVVLLVDHAEFKALQPGDLAGLRTRKVLDTRNVIPDGPFGAAGFAIVRLGEKLT